jgi:two-component system OmpR family response regulator
MSEATKPARHILIVEDERHLAIGLKYNFEAEGYRVTTVGDGPAALKLFDGDGDGSDFDLMILDLMLPGMSGYAVCEAVREKEIDIPILMLSARTLSEDRIRGFDAGTDQYMEKPFDLDELLNRVKVMLQRRARLPAVMSPAGPRSTYEFDGATINFETFEVVVRGQAVRLTYLEMKLLRYFIEREGKVVERSELLENVWGHSSTPTTRTVDNFILRLRKCFERDPANPQHFLSVRGAGYKFVANPHEPREQETIE